MVALDIDGTLTWADQKIPDEVRAAVEAVTLAGHQVVLASGRSLTGVLPVAHDLGLADGWVIAANGAITARLDPSVRGGCVVVEARTFDVEPVARLARERYPRVQIGVEEIGWGYRTNIRVPDEIINGRQRVVSPTELWRSPTPRVFLRGPHVLGLLRHLGALSVTATAGGSTDWIDVTPPGLSKASALDAVRERLGIAAEHTVAVGDGFNDLAMLSWARRGVAMGHAPSELIAVADEVTGTLAEMGVVPVLRSLLAPESPDGGFERPDNEA
jgi:hydroxymethylpyrimidine pyrophosphatase-like HAD family hydrolase